MKYIIRIIALPFFAALGLIHSVRLWVGYCIDFVRYGGEAVAYKKPTEPTIADVMNYVVQKLKEESA